MMTFRRISKYYSKRPEMLKELVMLEKTRRKTENETSNKKEERRK